MKIPTVNVLIGGEAGQGLLTVGHLLAKSLVRSGYHIVVTQSYQSRIRGGHNSFAIRVSPHEIDAPQESIDLLIALDAETVSIEKPLLALEAVVVVDEGLAPSDSGFTLLKVPYRDLAKPKMTNVAALGVAASLLGLDKALVSEAVDEFLGKHPESIEENRQALEGAYGWSAGQDSPIDPLPKVYDQPKRMMLHGNDAIAMGALSAGVKFCSFYPMTPATSISLGLAGQAKRMGLVVEQAEDEIAAINMAIGASYAGAPSMTATSGGGFALMVEGISLAAMTETPLVIVVSQRPGPATGLPTRTEQADLEFVLHAGHGEFPRAIFAPGSIEECFHLTRKAFEIAERYQGPAFLLTDQYLADSYQAVEPFDVERLAPVPVADRAPLGIGPYHRYALSDNGISPRLLPGTRNNLVVADSDEHDQAGHLTEDLSIRVDMVDKRLKKLESIRSEVVRPRYEGVDSPDLLLVSWGSTRGSASEAARTLRQGRATVATLHFPQVWPLVEDHFLHRLQSAKRVICVEGNATGQFANLIRRETGFRITERVLRYDGLPITPEYILRQL